MVFQINALVKLKKKTRLTELENPRRLRLEAGMERRRHQRNLTNVAEGREQRYGEEDEYHQEEEEEEEEEEEREEEAGGGGGGGGRSDDDDDDDKDDVEVEDEEEEEEEEEPAKAVAEQMSRQNDTVDTGVNQKLSPTESELFEMQKLRIPTGNEDIRLTTQTQNEKFELKGVYESGEYQRISDAPPTINPKNENACTKLNVKNEKIKVNLIWTSGPNKVILSGPRFMGLGFVLKVYRLKLQCLGSWNLNGWKIGLKASNVHTLNYTKQFLLLSCLKMAALKLSKQNRIYLMFRRGFMPPHSESGDSVSWPKVGKPIKMYKNKL
ncbi:hypothetical protein EAI_04560 [Harpegnathos saltator]|uniref:Uncharacterized protein n=1 Tax=Harpegnathos saltator TaxID=610380 RepID=E2C8X7_HARSA|nr:hypothetical protein EAI_04560 [Harpegnathos saltator]